MAKKKTSYVVSWTMPNGKRRYYRGATKKEAEHKRDEDKRKIEEGYVLDNTMKFKELAALWLGVKADARLHTRSMETIRGVMNRYILPSIGEVRVVDLRPMHIRKMMHDINSYSKSTQTKAIQYARSICELGLENGLLRSNPCVKSIRAQGKRPEEVVPLTDEQCRKLLEATKGTRVYVFILLCLYCGLRRSEALGLMWKDIDWQNRTLTVNRSVVHPADNRRGEINEECKSSAAHRTIPIVSDLYNELARLKRTSKSLFVISMSDGRFLTDTSFRNMWDIVKTRSTSTKTEKSVVKRPIDFDLHPHQLRHTCATKWVRSGMDVNQVMYLMGHSTVNITLEIYSHYQEEIMRTVALAKMEELQVSTAN